MSSGFILALPGVVQNPGQLHVATNNFGQGSFALAIEQGVLAMEDGLLQRPLAEVVVQWCAGHPQEQGEFLPVVLHVGDGLPEPGVGLHPMFLDLLFHPVVEGLHPWAALALMQEQACLGGQAIALGLLVGTEHRAQAL